LSYIFLYEYSTGKQFVYRESECLSQRRYQYISQFQCADHLEHRCRSKLATVIFVTIYFYTIFYKNIFLLEKFARTHFHRRRRNDKESDCQIADRFCHAIAINFLLSTFYTTSGFCFSTSILMSLHFIHYKSQTNQEGKNIPMEKWEKMMMSAANETTICMFLATTLLLRVNSFVTPMGRSPGYLLSSQRLYSTIDDDTPSDVDDSAQPVIVSEQESAALRWARLQATENRQDRKKKYVVVGAGWGGWGVSANSVTINTVYRDLNI
jgi:hypothetical protein